MSEDITAAAYRKELRDLAKQAKDDYQEHGGDQDANEFVSEWLHQHVDGHQWIIYTNYNSQVLGHSNNRDAYFDEYGTLEATDYGTAMAQMSFAAMQADLAALIDLNDFE